MYLFYLITCLHDTVKCEKQSIDPKPNNMALFGRSMFSPLNKWLLFLKGWPVADPIHPSCVWLSVFPVFSLPCVI